MRNTTHKKSFIGIVFMRYDPFFSLSCSTLSYVNPKNGLINWTEPFKTVYSLLPYRTIERSLYVFLIPSE